MRKISTLLMLFCAFVGTALAQNSKRISEGLLDDLRGTQYYWTSSKMTQPDGDFKKLRVTFLQSYDNSSPAGFPYVAIAEFYLYDKNDTPVTLTAEMFSSNATHNGEGNIPSLCDGFTVKQEGQNQYQWYWHSQWAGTPSPYGRHYLEINLEGVEADLSEYSFGWVTRQMQGSPKEIIVAAGATTEDVNKNTNVHFLPQVSTDIAKFYTIKSVRSKKYLAYNGDDVKPTQVSTLNDSCYWYFAKGSDDKVIVKNAATKKVLEGKDFTMASEGEWYVLPALYRPGVVFSTKSTINTDNCIDDQNGSIGPWHHASGDNEGTTWMAEEVVNAPVQVPALSIQGLKIASIGEPATELEIDKWYVLNNLGRGNIVSQEGNNWKMRAKNSVAVGDYANDKAGYLFKITKNGEYYNIYSGNGKYFQLGDNTSSTSANPVNFEIDKIGKSENVFYLFDKDHGRAADGQETGYNLVGWATSYPTNAENGNDRYALLPVELVKNIYEVTYNFVYQGVVKYSTTKSIAEGEDYPAVEVPVLPYGVTVNATKPEGEVTGNQTFDFALTISKDLPFQTATSVAEITTWYYAQMHANSAVTAYVEDNENGNNNVEWQDKTVGAEEIDSHLWGFVGDVWGVKMVNKGTGRAIVSTSGSAVLGDVKDATALVPTNSQANGVWFCMKYPANNSYLNAQGNQANGQGIIASWSSNDNGSSFKLTEYKEHNVAVSAAGYATLYLGQATYIPADVEVYAVTEVANGYVKMELVEGVLPANTGVILKNAGSYTFKTAGATGSVEGNLLLGSVENTYVEGEAYVLGKDGEGAGFFKATLNKNEAGEAGTTHFLNNANKAYLPATAGASLVLRFNFGGTTAIESVLNNGIDANAAIYDLSGRRVEKAVKGIYIQNGKKIIVK